MIQSCLNVFPCAEVTLVLNQVGPICKLADDADSQEPEMHELKSLVKRIVLQRQQAHDDDEESFDSD